jgi:CheY-specific phosphatase CheX
MTMTNTGTTIDVFAVHFCDAVKQVLQKGTKQKIKYSQTVQIIPKVSLRPSVGCFVQFTGDYNGLSVMNFSSAATMVIYKNYMIAMGMPENELAKDFTSKEVEDTMGEITNQIMGKAVRLIETKFNLSSFFGQPKALSLNSPITLSPDSFYPDNRRLTFSIATERFYMEVAMEQSKIANLQQKQSSPSKK